jgi:hypothetical protein
MELEQLREQLGRLVDKADNYVAAALLPVSPETHVEGLSHGMAELRDDIKKLYFAAGGEDVWS